MPLTLFAYKPPLDEESVQWIFEVYAWGLRHLDAATFRRDTILVIPNNKHFPGRGSSVEEMAALMFERTVAYAGMGGWPLSLLKPGTPLPAEVPRIIVPAPLRGGGGGGDRYPPAMAGAKAGTAIPIGYDPRLINNPEAMIAGFAQVLAHYLGSTVKEAPPGGIENWSQTTEVLGVFLGFGVLFANTAFTSRSRSCGSCGGPPADRQVFLSQYDVTYALALFSLLKDIPGKQILGPLKSSLRSYFKRCRKDIERREGELARLRTLARGQDGPANRQDFSGLTGFSSA